MSEPPPGYAGRPRPRAPPTTSPSSPGRCPSSCGASTCRTEVAAGAQLGVGAAARVREVLVNGLPWMVSWREDGSALSVMAFTVVDGQITGIAIVADPARLASTNLPHPG